MLLASCHIKNQELKLLRAGPSNNKRFYLCKANNLLRKYQIGITHILNIQLNKSLLVLVLWN